MEDRLTHIDENGRPRMVDVGEKADTKRLAVAKGSIYMHPETLKRVREGSIVKGDVLSVAQTAGIMAAKNTASNIPMCHNIFITGVDMNFEIDEEKSGDSHRGAGVYHRKDGNRDGVSQCGSNCGSHDLRHVQGYRQRHAYHRYPSGEERRRQVRRLYSGVIE